MSEPEEDISTTQRTGRISSEDTERDVRLREPPPDSGELETTRRSKPGGATDTLLSAPAPGSDADDGVARRWLEELERRVEQLEARIKVLELGRSGGAGIAPQWLYWVAFLLALAVVWLVARGLP